LTFDAEGGTTYYIRVAGVGESVGDITLNVETLERCIRRHDRMDPLEPGLERARRPSKRTPVGIGRDDR
jgi:hypothetical protein